MKSTNKPTHIRLEQDATIYDLKLFLNFKAKNESNTLFTGKGNNGTLLLHRLPEKDDSSLVRLGHFLRLGSERNQAREKIKDLLSSQGIELTDDIRKALPSRFSNGNATELLSAINKAPRLFKLEKIPE
jgi:hypothetical protein